MTPGEFIANWSDPGLRERAAAHSHFIDLCRVLGEQPPTDALSLANFAGREQPPAWIVTCDTAEI